jgi:glucose/arabinose dehydrogenase
MRARLVCGVLIAAAWLGMAAAQTITDPTVNLQVELVTAGLSAPTSMVFVDSDDILVLQKNNGQVRRVLGGELQGGWVLDVPVHFSSERGLLGAARDPDFLNNHFIYLFYTESSTGSDTNSSGSSPLGNRVYRYTWNGSALVDPVLVLDLPVTLGPNHDGGIVAFGPDDALYVVIGDLNRNGKLENFPDGPDPDDTGVILRVHPSGRALPDNPFFDAAAPGNPLNRYWAYGIRNSFGMSFDPLSGELWDTENGPSTFDEINRCVAGFNSGWEPLMGPDVRDPQEVGDLWVVEGSTYRDPEFSWRDTVAPTALTFAASRVLGCGLEHDLLVGDNNCGQLYRFKPSAGRDVLEFSSPGLQDRVADNNLQRCSGEMGEILFGSGWGAVTDLENGPDGRLYVVSLSEGSIFRIGPAAGAFPDVEGDGVDDACDCSTANAASFAPTDEIPRLRLSGRAPTSLGWNDQAGTKGSGTIYTVVSGELGELRDDAGYDRACALSEGDATPATVDSRSGPPPGFGYYYLVRAGNDCGPGSYGDGSELPDPREVLDGGTPPPCPGAARTGGAYITFSIVDESLTVWVTDDVFVDEALGQSAGGAVRVPDFQLADGPDTDPQWSWHVDPAVVSFADATIELCDGKPSFVEADKDYWLNTVGNFCPWSAVVDSVDDRR